MRKRWSHERMIIALRDSSGSGLTGDDNKLFSFTRRVKNLVVVRANLSEESLDSAFDRFVEKVTGVIREGSIKMKKELNFYIGLYGGSGLYTFRYTQGFIDLTHELGLEGEIYKNTIDL
ncbi:hypothetical protein MYX06_04580 [Patescibacteria group bacterium AH-259-L05]|nr:hypothetical protein [Patescibacteria group bacterium AH-259-L05]